MRISFRILLINFVIVVLVLGSAAVAFYSTMYEVLTSQQSQHLLTSANSFIYAFQTKLIETEDEFLSLFSDDFDSILNRKKLSARNIDFILELSPNNKVLRYTCNDQIFIPGQKFHLNEFLQLNPYIIKLKHRAENGIEYFFGRVITTELLDDLSLEINSDIAVVWNNSLTDVSSPSANQKYLYILTQAFNQLRNQENFGLYTEGTESNDIIATIYNPTTDIGGEKNISFLIFTSIGQAAALRATLKDLFIVIGLVGVALSLILTYLFTDKIRKQVTELSKATQETYNGNFNSRIKVKSKDELGKLGEAFNKMLDELEKKERAKNEYSEFITLINQNPTLKEIAEVAVKKIIASCGFVVGAIFSVDDADISLIYADGINDQHSLRKNNFSFFERVITSKETLELVDEQSLPVISTGLINVQLKYLLLLPVVYNNKTIAVLELGSVDKPNEEVKDYLAKIKDQLAIGITNAKALMQLENFVTELKKLNEDYQKQNIQIKKQNERLVELHDNLKEQARELEIQKQKAEESTKVKSQFLASMSHELRTPMNSILGLTELILEKSELDLKNKERLEVVFSSGKRLMTLINDILDLSKIEAGKMEIRYEDVLLDELLEEVTNSINPLASKKAIRFNIVRDTDTRIIINTDRGKVIQVLINLLGNAVKFTDSGSVTFKISSSENDLNFEVIDSGIGMNEEDKKLIFEEFRQIDGSTTRKYGGTGLGLTICRKITELMNGKISVESHLGTGSTFKFSVPLMQSGKLVPIVKNKVNVETLIKNRKNPILVIDDDEEVRYTIGQYLISKGYEVIYAEDGESGINMAYEYQPFAITLDVMLPNKDGWSVLKDLKENPKTKEIPVILISILGDKNIGYSLGAFEYFVKPISSDKLLSAFLRLENLAHKRIKKIVIVDDDELEFEKFKREFSSEGIRIEYIKDSELAFSKIAEVQPDLIILDLMMPKVDGVTLSYKLKSNIKTKHIPILISTAKDLSDEERKSLNSIVENIAVKSKGHPLDVLKIVRDRIKMQEVDLPQVPENGNGKNKVSDSAKKHDKPSIENDKEYSGNILIVDDDPDTLFTISEIVQACNCKTSLAHSGKECMEYLNQNTPDLILMDIMMPDMDGFQTFKQIRANEKWREIPVFAVTAKAMKSDKDIILKHGFTDYIPKPVNPTIISFKIEKLLAQLKAT
ncbi:MAG: response regulator [Ignavibacteria bacterium]|nr:response regulator [Ignavibacteria bacterium]MBT8383882.1 response regulator [Ignavibacteria bacterium]MBT8390555.1 response regulator [Ignavibacteria bacterium]NNJ51925.1 response regulator [Ignavibacteriaceae bacterium]NNL20415.1 response regulator [Ignavibacteriaceae bacterium]